MGYPFPERWRARKLDQLGFVGRGRSRHRPRNEPSLYGGQYPFFQTGDIKAANLYLSEHSQTYNEKGLAQSKQWDPGTLCITIAANIADTAILSIRGCFPDSVIGFIADPAEADVRFIKYYIDLIKLDMQQVSHGTTQDNLSLDKLLRFDFVLPDIEEQRKIAATLSAYDDLIENNLQRIKILEEMAQNIYSEWFVKFRFPGHEHVRFVDSPLGRIPEGWEVKSLLSVADVTYGSAFKSKQFNSDGKGMPVVRIRDVLAGISGTFSQQEAGKKYLVENGDILVGMDGDFHVGFWVGGQAYLVQRVARFRSKGEIGRYHLFLALQEPVQHFNATITGTTVAHLGDKHIKTIEIPWPPEQLAKQLDIFLEPMLAQILSLRIKNITLHRTRDLLLPKLISGEVDVSTLNIAVPEETEI